MSKHTATISVNGIEILSYVATPGFILSPSTMPLSIPAAIAEYAGFPAEAGAGLAWGEVTCEQVSGDVFRRTGEVEVVMQRWVGPNHTTTVDTPRIKALWVGTEDYSRA